MVFAHAYVTGNAYVKGKAIPNTTVNDKSMPLLSLVQISPVALPALPFQNPGHARTAAMPSGKRYGITSALSPTFLLD